MKHICEDFEISLNIYSNANLRITSNINLQNV